MLRNGMQTWEWPGWNLKLAPYPEGKKRRKTEEDHFRLVGRSFIKQGNLHTNLVLGSHKMSRSLHPLTTILEVYIEAITKFNHIFILKNLLSQRCVFQTASTMGNCGQHVHSKDRGGNEETLIAQIRFIGHVLSWLTSSNMVWISNVLNR